MPPTKSKYDPDKMPENIGRLAELGLTLKQIAYYFGVSEPTIERWVARPEVVMAYQNGKAKGLSTIAESLYQQAIKGNMTAIIFYLKTQGKWSEKQEIEHKHSGYIRASDSDDTTGEEKERLKQIGAGILSALGVPEFANADESGAADADVSGDS